LEGSSAGGCRVSASHRSRPAGGGGSKQQAAASSKQQQAAFREVGQQRWFLKVLPAVPLEARGLRVKLKVSSILVFFLL
jgi:hypothetical protein